jgi:hypothetical protein
MTQDELIEYYIEQIKEHDKLVCQIIDAETVQNEEVIDQDAQLDT